MTEAIYKYIHCDIYKRGVSVFIGGCTELRNWAKKFYKGSDEQDLIVQINKYCTDERYINNDIAASNYYSECSGQQVVHIPKFTFEYNPAEITNLSHELLHAVFNILDYVGVEYKREGTNESFTYMHEYVLKEALNKKGYKKA